ncbi:type IV toxin-antitoxin system AbiEi family antitoxin [Metapseudomonas resinovorans]|uniref:HTH iclR-type domain-containing protein n=1 Tax=Metapseudomonas resinovorans NBRC 106553 TaxID=1245471 RepID=S6AJF2_METRE|nr:type IV toxin-antitoxin system AbiEi family antitoxin [Pseudomonas resinovorans]BAN48595.1 hypothetical protein PCA10_28630 [Pseudomonas resinovorans NBRC 106553]
MTSVSHALGSSVFEGKMLSLLIAALSEALMGTANVEPGPDASFSTINSTDALLTLKGKGESVVVVVEVLRNAYPRDVRRAIWSLNEFKPQNRSLIRLIAAETLSPGAKQTLKDHGFAYFEKSGSLYLRSRRWFINIERPSKAPAKPSIVPLFTVAREDVVHALLMHTHQWMTGSELAGLAKTSSYTCSVVLQELERREWCESSGGGPTKRRRLVKPAELLDAWAEHWTQRKEQKAKGYLFVEDSKYLLSEAANRIYEAGLASKCVLTGPAAANEFAPLLTEVGSIDLIVPPGMTLAVMQALKLKPMVRGANVSIVEREASILLGQPFKNNSCHFASPYILYLDLLDGRGRNKELAEHLRVKLEQTWPT